MRIYSVIFFLTVLLMMREIPDMRSEKNHPLNFSAIFKTYSKRYDTLVVYSTNSYWNNGYFFYKIIGFRKGNWYFIKHYEKQTGHKNDSVITQPCVNCAAFFPEILSAGILTIPDESQLINECRSTRDTMINGKKVQEITDLNAISDIETENMEYKIGKMKGKISYRSLKEALKICPQSKERVSASKICSLLKNMY